VLVATLFPCADRIAGVGGPGTIEIGGLGDLGGFGSRTRTFAMCGGGTCGSELWLTPLVLGVLSEVSEAFQSRLVAIVRR
jgi:hypothetical protein